MATLDKKKFDQGHSKPWRARVMIDYRHVDLGYHATWDEANTLETRFRECFAKWQKNGKWTGKQSAYFSERYAKARVIVPANRRSIA